MLMTMPYYGWTFRDAFTRTKDNGWTLTNISGEILDEAEALFGRRDHSVTMLGIEFHEGPPFLCLHATRPHVTINLSLGSRVDSRCAILELAHETVHLLNPAQGPAGVLEEGLATFFSKHICERSFDHGGVYACHCIKNEYRYALDALAPILGDLGRLKELRTVKPRFAELKAEDLVRLFPQLDRSRAELLCMQPLTREFPGLHPLAN
jgi:hypothetical protein